MSDLLRAQDVYVSFYTAKETVRVLNGFSFSVQPGDIIGLVGESGSGKSVAISAMIALLGKTGKIDSGEILFKGQNVLALNEEQLRDLRCREIGVIPNNPKGMLHPIVPIGNQLENRYRSAHPTAKKEQARARAIQALEMVQIPDPVKRLAVLPGELSGGMAQRVLIAMALINEPNLVIADDATTGLDVTVQSQILDLIEAQVQRTGSAAVMVTHDLGIVAQYCKKVAILCMGKIVEASDSVEELLHNAAHPYTRTLLSATPGVPRKYEPRVDPPKAAHMAIPAEGCILQHRCRNCRQECLRSQPGKTEVAPGHWVDCCAAGEVK